jgi:hypothetical protein
MRIAKALAIAESKVEELIRDGAPEAEILAAFECECELLERSERSQGERLRRTLGSAYNRKQRMLVRPKIETSCIFGRTAAPAAPAGRYASKPLAPYTVRSSVVVKPVVRRGKLSRAERDWAEYLRRVNG